MRPRAGLCRSSRRRSRRYGRRGSVSASRRGPFVGAGIRILRILRMFESGCRLVCLDFGVQCFWRATGHVQRVRLGPGDASQRRRVPTGNVPRVARREGSSLSLSLTLSISFSLPLFLSLSASVAHSRSLCHSLSIVTFSPSSVTLSLFLSLSLCRRGRGQRALSQRGEAPVAMMMACTDAIRVWVL